MSHPINSSANQSVTSVALTDTAKANEVKQSGKAFNRSVSVAEASPQKGLRTKARNFLPRPLYKFVANHVLSSPAKFLQLGKEMSQASAENTKAGNELGQYFAQSEAKPNPKQMYQLQLNYQESNHKLDNLRGLGDSPVAAERQKVITLLKQCVENPQDQKLAESYQDACKKLDTAEKIRDNPGEQKQKLKQEAKSLSETVEAARPLATDRAAELVNISNKTEFTPDEQNILDKADKASAKLKEVKKELSALKATSRQYDKSQVDVDRANRAQAHYENVETNRSKGKG